MKQAIRYLLIIALFTHNTLDLNSQTNQENNRKLLFDFDWSFTKDTIPDVSELDAREWHWRNLDVPHDWSIEGKFDINNPMGGAGGYLPDGIGWYMKKFEVPSDWKDRKVIIYFEGVYMNSEVFVNGISLGRHPYGYTSFHYDLTPHINYSGDNTIAVKVDNSEQVNCRWYSGSGIYRHVWLFGYDKTHIDHWGVFIHTPEASEKKAIVQVKTLVRNDMNTDQALTLTTELKDKNNKNAGSNKIAVNIPANSQMEISQSIHVKKPLLWSPESPDLYIAQQSLGQKSQVLDRTETSFGIRTIEYSSEKGFLLNGKSTVLFGGCVHHDNGCLGAKAFDRAEERKAELLKNAGFNSVRTSHNPPSEAFLDACDRIGLLVIDESFDGWRERKTPHDYSKSFDAWWKRDIQSMIYRDRNHPSIVMWSIGNEIIERTSPEAVKTAKMLSDAIKEIDATRPVTSAMTSWNQGWEVFDALMAEHDICGYNYALHEAEQDHERVPSRVIFQSESYPKDVFYTWNIVNKHRYIIGDFVWTAMDYLGESGIGRTIYPGDTQGEHWETDHFPWHGAYCGDIDLNGWRKPVSHYRSLLWTDREKLYMAVREPNPVGEDLKTTMWAVWPTWESWTWPGHEGKDIDVVIYSKYEKVRLYLNDSLIGEKATTVNEEFKASFTLPYREGVLRAAGVLSNKEAESISLKTAGKAYKINAAADRKSIKADGQDLSYINIEIVDKEGNLDPNASNLLEFSIEGPGEIIGVDNANLRDITPYTGSSRKAWKGRALVVVKSKRKPGEIKLNIHSEGLPDSTVTITTL